MAEKLETFINTSPNSGEFRLYYSSSNSDIFLIGSTISTSSNNSYDITKRIKGAEEIRLFYNNNGYNSKILNRVFKGGYYYLELAPTIVYGTGSYAESLLYFYPHNYGYEYKDAIVTVNNVKETRASSLVKEVDRVQNEKNPTNYQRIVSGTADTAKIQDSNYTSIGWTNARYSGCKLTTENASLQGTDPCLSLTTFVGTVSENTADNTSICPLVFNTVDPTRRSPNEETLYFNRKKRVYPNNCYTYYISRNSNYQGDISLSVTYFDCSLNEINIIVVSEANSDIIYLYYSDGTYIEGNSINASYILTKGLLKYINFQSTEASELSPLSYEDSIEVTNFPVSGSTVYRLVNNNAVKMINKKIWIKELNVIRETDSNGRILYDDTYSGSIHYRGYQCPTLALSS